jgi:hypothetical protein
VASVLEFLTELFENGVGYSAINTARSALSAVLPPINAQTVGSHPHVVRFLKGVFELRTPKPKYDHIWDVGIVLSFFKEKQENSSLPLPDLTHKLCALILLASAQRVQTVHLIRVPYIFIQSNHCEIIMVDVLKHTTLAKNKTVLKFDRFSDKKLCVIATLEEYLKRTEKIRKSVGTDKLFLCYRRPFGPASKDTLARWMKNVLENAGIQNFAPHSFRSASSTDMLLKGCTS